MNPTGGVPKRDAAAEEFVIRDGKLQNVCLEVYDYYAAVQTLLAE